MARREFVEGVTLHESLQVLYRDRRNGWLRWRDKLEVAWTVLFRSNVVVIKSNEFSEISAKLDHLISVEDPSTVVFIDNRFINCWNDGQERTLH